MTVSFCLIAWGQWSEKWLSKDIIGTKILRCMLTINENQNMTRITSHSRHSSRLRSSYHQNSSRQYKFAQKHCHGWETSSCLKIFRWTKTKLASNRISRRLFQLHVFVQYEFVRNCYRPVILFDYFETEFYVYGRILHLRELEALYKNTLSHKSITVSWFSVPYKYFLFPIRY